MFKNKLKETLKNGKSAIGIFIIMCNCAELVEIAGISGFDFANIGTVTH